MESERARENEEEKLKESARGKGKGIREGEGERKGKGEEEGEGKEEGDGEGDKIGKKTDYSDCEFTFMLVASGERSPVDFSSSDFDPSSATSAEVGGDEGVTNARACPSSADSS